MNRYFYESFGIELVQLANADVSFLFWERENGSLFFRNIRMLRNAIYVETNNRDGRLRSL